MIKSIKKWFKDRIIERTSIDGLVLITLGIGILFFMELAVFFAGLSIVYGLITFIRKERGVRWKH